MKTSEFFTQIDWSELRKQKEDLLSIISTFENKSELHDSLTGILHLIDAIQDYAVDVMNLPGTKVFNSKSEEIISKELKFAIENARTIFETIVDGDIMYDILGYESGMTKEFMLSVVNDRVHSDLILGRMSEAIYNDVCNNPLNFDVDEDGDFTYDYEMRDAYGGIIEQYCLETWDNVRTKNIFKCKNCGSDSVQTRQWVGLNQNSRFDDNDQVELFCLDCGNYVEVEEVMIPYKSVVIGFQPVDINSGESVYGCIGKVLSLSQARSFVKSQFRSVVLKTIWSGDIENPKIMFEGDPRR